MIRVASSITPFSKRCLVAGLLELQFENVPLFGLAFHLPPFRQHRRLDCHRLNRTDQLADDRCVDAQPAEHHTSPLPEHHVRTVASIHGLADPPGRARGVVHRQTASATATNQEPDEKRSPAAAGLGAIAATVGVGGQLLLVAFELRPIDVSLVMALQEDLAVFEGAVMTVGLPGTAIDNRGAVLALTVGVGARVEGVLEHRNDVAVADRRPLERGHLLAVRGAGKVDALGPERQMGLPSAAKLPEATEDQSGCFLNPHVGIKAQSDLAMPQVTYGDGNPQFSPPRLRTGGVEHPRTQDAQLELADAALHPEQQAIVGATRVIDTVEIDDARLDEPTELQKVMPIAAVPGEPRGVEAKNGANLAGAQPSDELLKSGPGDGAARRATEVVVDDFDVAKSASAGLVNELILTPLALQVDLHLGLR